MFVRGYMRNFAKKFATPFIKNEEIIFDKVRVVDSRGVIIGDMDKSEGIRVAREKSLDLFLVDFHTEPPVCQISDAESIGIKHHGLDDASGFSFDPTKRPATTQLSAVIAKDDFDRKMGILRNHLLEKARCEVVVINKDRISDAEEMQQVVTEILEAVKDIAKLADEGEMVEVDGVIRLHVWPCNPNQVVPLPVVQLEAYDEETVLIEEDRRERRIRNRIDPKLDPDEKHPRRKDDIIDEIQ